MEDSELVFELMRRCIKLQQELETANKGVQYWCNEYSNLKDRYEGEAQK